METVKPESFELRWLRCPFTNEQLLQMSQSLSRQLRELQDLQERKTVVNAEFSKDMKGLHDSIRRMGRCIGDQYECRDVRCKILWHQPMKGQKTIVRLDTGEDMGIEPMTEAELQDSLPFSAAEPTEDQKSAASGVN